MARTVSKIGVPGIMLAALCMLVTEPTENLGFAPESL
jgi:hypothetical protein